jgi:ribosomal protein L11 methylase PrmA
VVAVDLDEVAVDVATETARLNDVVVEVSRADVLRDELVFVDVVVANIELGIVERFLERATARVAITSGYLQAETPKASRWTRLDRLELEGWAADVFRLAALS